jgi:DNA-binding CsgD family transcriptional regulator
VSANAPRIARDLHDSLGHQLTLTSLYAGTLGSADEQQREATVGLLRTTSAAAMGELRQILGILHQEDGGEQGTAQPLSSLDDLIGAAASAGATITLSRDGEPRPLPPLVEHAAYRVIQEGVTVLSNREREVLLLLAQGLSNAAISEQLWITEATVKTHVSRVFTKLDCDNRVQAVLLVHRAGLLQ